MFLLYQKNVLLLCFFGGIFLLRRDNDSSAIDKTSVAKKEAMGSPPGRRAADVKVLLARVLSFLDSS